MLSSAHFATKESFNVGLLSDIHLMSDYNPDSSANDCKLTSSLYSQELNSEDSFSTEVRAPLGRLGCDSPPALVELVLLKLQEKH
jgi:hypothetical protein